jgi:hypothetical protein
MRAISNGGFALIDFASILAEEADLERKLEAVRLMKAAYGVGSGVTTVAPLAVERAKPVARKSRDLSDRMDKFGLYGQHIIDSALLMLPGADHNPLPTRNLVTMLETIGVDIRGENKVNALSALLARSTKIKGHGRSGWTLAVPHGEADVDALLLDQTEKPSSGGYPVDGSETSSQTLAEEAPEW